MKNEGSIKDLSRQKKDLINFKIDPLRLSSLSNGKKKIDPQRLVECHEVYQHLPNESLI